MTSRRVTRICRPAALLLLVSGAMAGVGTETARADGAAAGIVLTQDQLPDYQADEADSITNTVGGSGDLAGVLTSCAQGDALLAQFGGGSDAAVGGAFGRGSYSGGFQNGVQTVAVVGSSSAAAAQSLSAFSGATYTSCVEKGDQNVFGSLAQVQSVSEAPVTTPKLGDGVSAFQVVVQFSASGLSGWDTTTLTLVRSDRAIVLLVTFALGDTAAAAQFPDADRQALAQLLVGRVAPALGAPPPSSGPALDGCVLSSHSVEVSSSATAASVSLGTDASLTLSRKAGDAAYSVDADAGLKPGLKAAFGAADGGQGVAADISAGLQFSNGAGYEKLSSTDAKDLMKWFATNSGSNTASARAGKPDSITQSVGAWTEGDVRAGPSSGGLSGAVTLGMKTDMHDGKPTGYHVYLDITGELSGNLGALLDGATVQSGAAADEEAILTLDAQPNGLPVGVSAHVTTDLLTGQQVQGAGKVSHIDVSGSSQAQKGTETDLVVSASANDDAHVTSAIETLAEAMTADSSGGPGDAAVSQAESVIAGVAQAILLQSNLTKQTVKTDLSGGFDGVSLGLSTDSAVLDKELTYAAYSTPGNPALVPWTACAPVAASTGNGGPPASGPATTVNLFNPWASGGPGGAAQPASGLSITNASGTCDSGSLDDPGRAAAYRCTTSGTGALVLSPCFADTTSGDTNSPVLCSQDPTSKQAVLLALGGTTLPTQATNTDDPGAAAWFLVLADGHKCKFSGTGTNNDVLPYDCGGGVVATAPDRSQPQWTVQEGVFQANATPSGPRVAVTEAFR